jgi:hypothetical protein
MCLSLLDLRLCQGFLVNHSLLNTQQATRRLLAKQSGKGMKKGLSLLVENNFFLQIVKQCLLV